MPSNDLLTCAECGKVYRLGDNLNIRNWAIITGPAGERYWFDRTWCLGKWLAKGKTGEKQASNTSPVS